MKNVSLIASSIVTIFVLMSCSKTELVDKGSFTNEIANEEVQLYLDQSGYSINKISVQLAPEGFYATGEIEYLNNSETLAEVAFSAGEATINKKGAITKHQCKKDKSKYKGKDSKYKKVIVEPLVKTDDCGYITSGIIKYYELKSGAWTATINYGKGTCDDNAVKTTKEGDYTFSLDDWK